MHEKIGKPDKKSSKRFEAVLSTLGFTDKRNVYHGRDAQTEPTVEAPVPTDVETPQPSLKDKMGAVALELTVTEPHSSELREISGTFAGGRVRQFGGNSPLSSKRTELDLPDGRTVVVHDNVQPVMGLAARRFDLIEVTRGGETIDTFELKVDPTSTSPYNPSYTVEHQGETLPMLINGEVDLALADEFFDGAVSTERGIGNFSGHYGNARQIAPIILEQKD